MADPRLPNDPAWKNAEIARGINKMELFRRIHCGNLLAGLQATSKATMCLEINRYENYVPIPKQTWCTPYQGLGEPKITGLGWDHAVYNIWNQ